MLLFCFSNQIQADTVWIEGQDTPVHGLIESIDANRMKFQATVDGVKFETIAINKDRIIATVVSHDLARLEALNPGQWTDYYFYGEELVSQASDPMARLLAVRLFAIVAWNANEHDLKDAAMANLIALAITPKEKTALHQLRYLETGILPPAVNEQASKPKIPEDDRLAAIELLKMIRQGRSVTERLRIESLKRTINVFESTCSWDELIQIAKSNRINDEHLRRLVALEHEIRTANNPTAEVEKLKRQNWNSMSRRIVADSFILSSVESVTGVDPRANMFRNGSWHSQ